MREKRWTQVGWLIAALVALTAGVLAGHATWPRLGETAQRAPAAGEGIMQRTDVLTPTAHLPIVLNARGYDKWDLWTGGAHLRGANTYQRRVYPALDGDTFMGAGLVGPPYTQADLDNLAALGANYVNISHPGLFTEKPPYVLDPAVEANLDSLLSMSANADMFAVISFRTGPGRSEFTFFWDEVGAWFDASYLNDSMWQDQAAQDAWVSMWRYTAQRYRDNPIVVGYDLMVEPNSNEVGSHALNDPLDIWDPAEFYSQYGGTLYDWNQLYPRISAAIRQVDTKTPILIGGMGYSAVNWLPYLTPTGDARTIYTVHQYAPTVYTHQEPPLVNTYPGVFDADWDGDDDQVNRAWLDNLLSTIDTFTNTHGAPVAVNEFGLMRWEPGAAAFMDDEMDLFESRGMNHALWLWETSWVEYVAEVHAFNFRFGPDPANRANVNSALRNVILKYWGRNTVRPSSVKRASASITRPDGAVRLTTPPAGASDQNPAFSPDGTRLVFTRFANGYNVGPAGLLLLQLSTGQVTRLTPTEDQDNVNLPGSAWNATSNRIVLASDRSDADDLWRIAPDGTDFTRITVHSGLPWYIEPSWSPPAGGPWIVFEGRQPGASEDGSVGQVWKVRSNGTGMTPLTGVYSPLQGGARGGFDDRQPNWSPAGDRILFQRRTLPDGDWDIYTIAPDGAGVGNATNSPAASDTDASWSPDGTCIVYSSDYGGLPVPNIYAIPAAGGVPVRVTFSDTHEDGAPSWSPDGHWIVFESHEGQDEDTPSALWRIAVPSGVCRTHRAYLPLALKG